MMLNLLRCLLIAASLLVVYLAGAGVAQAQAQNPPHCQFSDNNNSLFPTVPGAANQSPEFLNALSQTAGQIGVTPTCLAAIISFETGHSFAPAQTNNVNHHCTGLIQFC